MEKVKKSEHEWRNELTPEQYEVVRNKGTEAPFTSELNDVKEPGQFVCVACGQPLFDSEHKFDSGTGWPSFDRPMDDEKVETEADNSLFMKRTEVRLFTMRRASGARLRRRPGRHHRPALLHQRLRPRVQARGLSKDQTLPPAPR